MGKQKKRDERFTQWHPAFCSAMKLELVDNKQDLSYQSEFCLNTKPLVIDLLVIRKDKETKIVKDIGRFFRGHNILEYKSPDDALNIDTFYKGIAYVSLYKSNGVYVNEIKSEDITLSFVRRRMPKGLFQELQKEGMEIHKTGNGIYHVTGAFPFGIQIIVSRELERKEYIWLTSLTDDLTLQNAEQLISEASAYEEKDDKEYVDSVLQVVVSKNRVVFQQVKEGKETMCEALKELMKPEWDAMVEELQAEMEAKKAEMEAKKAEMEAKKAEMEAKKAEMEAQKAEMEAQKAEMEVQKAEMEAQKAEMKVENAKMKAEIKALKEQLSKMSEKRKYRLR